MIPVWIGVVEGERFIVMSQLSESTSAVESALYLEGLWINNNEVEFPSND